MIAKNGWQLVRETGEEVFIGEVLYDFRGNPEILRGGQSPAHPGSTGRVEVGPTKDETSLYYPGVFNLTWRPL